MDSYQCHDLSMASASLSPLVLASNSSSPQPGSPLVKSNGSPTSSMNGSSSATPVSSSSNQKTRMVIDWTDWEAEILMTEYETHRCLWDPSHPNYHSNSERTHAYVKILDKLGDKFNITDIKKKINSIRTQFNQVSVHLDSPTPSISFISLHQLNSNCHKPYLKVGFLVGIKTYAIMLS